MFVSVIFLSEVDCNKLLYKSLMCNCVTDRSVTAEDVEKMIAKCEGEPRL